MELTGKCFHHSEIEGLDELCKYVHPENPQGLKQFWAEGFDFMDEIAVLRDHGLADKDREKDLALCNQLETVSTRLNVPGRALAALYYEIFGS